MYELFKEHMQGFLISLTHEKRVSEHTQKAYMRDLKQFATYMETRTQENLRIPLQQSLENFFSHLSHKGITASSIARKISCFNSFKKYVKKRGTILPIELKRPPVILAPPVSLPMKESAHVLNLVSSHDLPTPYPYRDKAIVELIYATGITCSELVSIN